MNTRRLRYLRGSNTTDHLFPRLGQSNRSPLSLHLHTIFPEYTYPPPFTHTFYLRPLAHHDSHHTNIRSLRAPGPAGCFSGSSNPHSMCISLVCDRSFADFCFCVIATRQPRWICHGCKWIVSHPVPVQFIKLNRDRWHGDDHSLVVLADFLSGFCAQIHSQKRGVFGELINKGKAYIARKKQLKLAKSITPFTLKATVAARHEPTPSPSSPALNTVPTPAPSPVLQ